MSYHADLYGQNNRLQFFLYAVLHYKAVDNWIIQSLYSVGLCQLLVLHSLSSYFLIDFHGPLLASAFALPLLFDFKLTLWYFLLSLGDNTGKHTQVSPILLSFLHWQPGAAVSHINSDREPSPSALSRPGRGHGQKRDQFYHDPLSRVSKPASLCRCD